MVALTETWLDADIPSSMFCPPNYTTYRCDRSGRRGGGSLLLINKNVESKSLEVNYLHSSDYLNINIVGCELSLDSSRKLGILCIYRPPDASMTDNMIMINTINTFLQQDYHNVVILGDFNFSNITWPTSASSFQSKAFLNFCQENFLVQHVDAPTRIASGAILDLVLTSQELPVFELSVGEEFGSSDHSIIQFSASIKYNQTRRKIRRRKMKDVDWPRFRELLQPTHDWYDALSTKDIDLVWSHFITSINLSLNEIAPFRLFSPRGLNSSPKIRTALRYKRRCFRNLCITPSFLNLAIYEKSKIIACDLIKDDLRSREDRIIKTPDQRLFWSYVNSRLSKDSSIRLIKHDGLDLSDSEKIANVFNEYFVSTYSKPSVQSTSYNNSLYGPPYDSGMFLHQVTFSLHELFQMLSSLPPKSSVDADDLSYKILRNGGLPICIRLHQLFSLSLELCRIPSSWKTAIISPIHKANSRHFVRNYRPISVTSCCARLLERIVNNKITNYLIDQNKISNTQHGFISGKSTDTILLKFYDFVTDCVDRNKVVDCIFFDFQKAFDTVPHCILLSRLHTIGIRGPILAWLDDLLSNRKQMVRIDRSFSQSLPVSSGVIQGSVLGPTLFNIFVDDLDNSIRHCQILKYADDTRIFRSADKSNKSVNCLKVMVQEDIDNIVKWSNDSGLKLNIKKCFSVSFGRHATTRDYEISGLPIPKMNYYKDLGLNVSSPICFNTHVDIIVAKAFTKLGIIKKIFVTKTPKNIIKLYKAFVRPHLEYSSIIWSPYTLSSINNVERVQRRMCRLIPEVRHLSYRQQLGSLGLLSLEARRLRFQLITLFKIYKGQLKITLNELFDVSDTRRTRGHSCHITPRFSAHNYRLNFFTNSVVSYWNKLSQDDIDASSLLDFKIRITTFFLRFDIW